MNINIAKISVQNSFCNQSCDMIRSKIQEVTELSNVILYPSESLVIFNFKKANELSEVLNVLTALGFPPKGDRLS